MVSRVNASKQEPISKRLRSASEPELGAALKASLPPCQPSTPTTTMAVPQPQKPAPCLTPPASLTPHGWDLHLRLCNLAQTLYGMSDDEFESAKHNTPELWLQSLRFARRHIAHKELPSATDDAPFVLSTSPEHPAEEAFDKAFVESFKRFTARMSQRQIDDMLRDEKVWL